MESRTGCDASLSSPHKVGYLRTFTHIKRKRAGTGGPLSPFPSGPTSSSAPKRTLPTGTTGGVVAILTLLLRTCCTSAGPQSSSQSLLASRSCLEERKACCLAQMSCPWQTGQNPGSSPAPLKTAEMDNLLRLSH